MSENVLKTLQQLVQDVIAPDVRELKVRVASLEKQMDANHQIVLDKMDTQFRALMAAISEAKAQNELSSYKLISSLAERVAVLEARRAS